LNKLSILAAAPEGIPKPTSRCKSFFWMWAIEENKTVIPKVAFSLSYGIVIGEVALM